MLIGKPVALVNVADVGVPKIGVTSVGLVDKTFDPEPVDVTTPVPPLATGNVPEISAVEISIASQAVFVPSLFKYLPEAEVCDGEVWDHRQPQRHRHEGLGGETTPLLDEGDRYA